MELKGRIATVVSVLILLLVRLIQRIMEYQYIVPAGLNTNATLTSDEGALATVTSWMYTCRYLLPVFGGLLACWMGHVRALQLGGSVMLVSTAFMSAAVYQDRWRGDSGVALVACLLMLVYNGLVIPNVMHGVLLKRTQTRHRTVLCAIIYVSSAAGLYAGVEISRLPNLIGRQYALVCLAMVAAYCAIALLVLPRTEAAAEHAGDANAGTPVNTRALCSACQRVELPTQSRLKRSCLVFAALLPLLFGVSDDRASVLKSEKRFLLALMSDESLAGGGDYVTADGGSGARETATSALLAAGLVVANLALSAASCLLRRPNQRIPIRPRIVAGISLQAVMELALAVVSSAAVRFASPTGVDIFYTSVAAIDALSSVLVMVAAYEMLDQFERDLARPVIVGVMLTVWGIGQVASRLLVMACQRSVYHVTLLLLLVASLVYCWFCAFPLANTLMVNYECVGPDEAELLDSCERLEAGDEDREIEPLLLQPIRLKT